LLLLALVVALAFLQRPAFAQNDDDSVAPQAKRDRASDSARESEMSSSKDTRIDLSPPRDDAKNHPDSQVAISDSINDPDDAPSTIDEMHAWDPHKAAKDVEVGDYYFKRKNYRGALERYKDALIYKPNDAIANFRLAECSEKVGNPADAAQHYDAYLKILPNGPFAADAKKALDRLKSTPSK
jgi:tetratricopeptide (TPR) repeat protein